ncbi:chaplin [Streptomyces sp. NPDC090306]|uniref:chaplin n=1 Tax=Streptomyces sp. NPDC090306 TaxID=3365961 RepID=UPI00382785B0
MRQTLSRSVVAATAATSILSLCGGTAQADTYASGGASDSPGLLSGNSIQAPVDAPVNACGNSVDAVGALNPAFGNSCGGGSGSQGLHHGQAHVPAQHTPSAAHGARGTHGGTGYGDSGRSGSGYGDSGHGGSGYGDSGYGDSGYGNSGHGRGGHEGSFAHGPASDSPGIGSGNSVEVPVHAPVNLCGNTVDIVGIGNGAFGNSCGEQGGYGDDSPGGYGDTPGGYGDDTPPTRTPPGHPHHPPTTRNMPPGETPPGTPPSHGTPPAHPRGSSVARHHATAPALAETGAGSDLAGAAAAAAALIAGGAVLYRRGRVASQR